eukprot:1484380-Rhodomonas_salina.2
MPGAAPRGADGVRKRNNNLPITHSTLTPRYPQHEHSTAFSHPPLLLCLVRFLLRACPETDALHPLFTSCAAKSSPRNLLRPGPALAASGRGL